MLAVKKLSILGIVVFVLGLVMGCASTHDKAPPEGEAWVGTTSGMADGELSLFVSKAGDHGHQSVTGRLNMNLDKTAGGYGSGKLKGRIRGTLVDGELKATVFGQVFVTGGSSAVTGKLTGTMTETKASGSWNFSHSEGIHSGQWKARKVD